MQELLICKFCWSLSLEDCGSRVTTPGTTGQFRIWYWTDTQVAACERWPVSDAGGAHPAEVSHRKTVAQDGSLKDALGPGGARVELLSGITPEQWKFANKPNTEVAKFHFFSITESWVLHHKLNFSQFYSQRIHREHHLKNINTSAEKCTHAKRVCASLG